MMRLIVFLSHPVPSTSRANFFPLIYKGFSGFSECPLSGHLSDPAAGSRPHGDSAGGHDAAD
ncbi:MAG: hypothetical protein ACREOX_11380, partial [Stenotrophomonas sp.]